MICVILELILLIRIKHSLIPPTNLFKCLLNNSANDDITFKTRSKSTFSCAIDIDDPSCTLICTYSHMPRLFIPINDITNNKKWLRPYTILECARIQGFPDTHQFYGNNNEIIKQTGNAIPPIIIQTIFQNIINLI